MQDTQCGAIVRLPLAKLRLHPACDVVPEMRPAEWAEFLADVGRRGIVDPPIVMNCPTGNGWVILDGRHRFRAARIQELQEIECRLIDIPADKAEAYVIAAALHRRHLTDSQRAILAEKYRKPLAEKTKQQRTAPATAARQRNGECRQNEKSHIDKDLGRETSTEPTNNREQMAKAFGVTEYEMRQAKVVIDGGTDELIALVESGQLTLARAQRLAKFPATKQRSIIAGGQVSIMAALRQSPPQIEPQKPKEVDHGPSRTILERRARAQSEEPAEQEEPIEIPESLMRLEASKMLNAVHNWNVAAEQMAEHGYLGYALKNWPEDRKNELAGEAKMLADEMSFWHGNLTANTENR